MKSIKTITLNTAIIMEGSWGESDLGTHESTMEFFEYEDGNAPHAMIEWNIPALEEIEHIGLTFEMLDGKRTLTDYDGVHSLPDEAIALVESLGIVVPVEFKS